VAAGTAYWVLFGIGAMAGPVLSGHLADRTGFGAALRVALLVEAVAVGLPVLDLGPIALAVSSVVVGASVPGIVTLVLGRVHELLADRPGDEKGGDQKGGDQKAAWSTATTSFAVLQAVAAYSLSYLFVSAGGAYHLLFGLGAVAMALALAVDLVAAARAR
jgi:MFS family permease